MGEEGSYMFVAMLARVGCRGRADGPFGASVAGGGGVFGEIQVPMVATPAPVAHGEIVTTRATCDHVGVFCYRRA
jgi:hypothetical protein